MPQLPGRREVDALPADERRRLFASLDGAVFARTEPRHKQLVVQALREAPFFPAKWGKKQQREREAAPRKEEEEEDEGKDELIAKH